MKLKSVINNYRTPHYKMTMNNMSASSGLTIVCFWHVIFISCQRILEKFPKNSFKEQLIDVATVDLLRGIFEKIQSNSFK